MPQITREIDVLKQLFENLSEQDKQQFLLDVSKSKSTLQKIIQPRKISCCPHCQSSQFVKNGKTDGNQRYLCKECGRTFVESTGTILFGVRDKKGPILETIAPKGQKRSCKPHLHEK